MSLLGIHRLLSRNWPSAGITWGPGSSHAHVSTFRWEIWTNKSLDKLTDSLEASSGSSMTITPCFFFTVVCQKNSGSPSWFENFDMGINTSPCRTQDEPACCFRPCQHCPGPFHRHRRPGQWFLKSCLRSAPDPSLLSRTEECRDYRYCIYNLLLLWGQCHQSLEYSGQVRI